MTDEDWERLHAKVSGTIGAYQRRRRTRVLLIAAAVLVVALVALAATWHLTRPGANSRADVLVVCASETVADAGGAVVPLDGLIPSPGAHASGPTAQLGRDRGTPVGRLRARRVRGVRLAHRVPGAAGEHVRRARLRAVPPAFAEQAQRFSQVQDALAALPVDDGCVSFGDARAASRIAR